MKKISLPRISNLIASLIICFNLINGAIGAENVSYLTIGCIFVLFAIGIINKEIKIYLKHTLIVVYVIIIFIVSFMVVPNTEYTWYYFRYFCGFCILALFIGSQNIDTTKVTGIVERIGCICVIVFIVRGINNYDVSLQMGIAYSMLPVLYASAIDLINEKKWKTLPIINIVGIFYCYFNYAPRGVLLNIAITVLAYMFIKITENKSKSKRVIIRIVTIVMLIVFLFIVFTNLSQVLVWINDLAVSIFGRPIQAIGKALYLLSIDDLGNGRSELLDFVKTLIKDDFIFGNGIGYFESYEMGYTHNIIFQAICEAGVFLFIPLIYIFCKSLKELLSDKLDEKERYNREFFLLLFSTGIVTLFYSSVYWQFFTFWFLLGYIMRNCK